MADLLTRSLQIYKYFHSKNIEFSNEFDHKFYVFRSVTAGRIVAVCQGKVLEVNKDEMLYIPPERHADIKIFAEPHCYGTVIRLRYFPAEDELSFPPQAFKIKKDVAELINNQPNIEFSNITNRTIWQTYKIITMLQSDMVRYDYNDKQVFKLRKALEFMRQTNNYTIDQVAAYCGMSTRRFNAVFKEVLNITPVQMKQKLQAIKAEKLLKSTDISIEEVAKRIGYSSSNQLRNILKNRYAKLPKTLRKG